MTDLHGFIQSLGIRQLSNTPHGYKGCCSINPNHYDNNPSMHIHIQKGHVKCFSCGAYKPLFRFLIDNDAPFDLAIRFILQSNEDVSQKKAKGLNEYLLGRYIPKSMVDRGFKISTLKHFKVGYDDVNDRITIPLYFDGVLYGVQYRRYPKQFWTTDNFVKDQYLYNLERSKERIIVEGFTDTWRVHQNGSKNVTAMLHALASEGQLEILREFDRLYLALDHDYAGLKGMFHIDKHLGRDTEIFYLPYGNTDPGGCTKEQWEVGINNPKTMLELKVQTVKNHKSIYEKIMSEI
jgi:DNA primase